MEIWWSQSTGRRFPTREVLSLTSQDIFPLRKNTIWRFSPSAGWALMCWSPHVSPLIGPYVLQPFMCPMINVNQFARPVDIPLLPFYLASCRCSLPLIFENNDITMYTINALYYPPNKYTFGRRLRWNKRKITLVLLCLWVSLSCLF